MADGVPDRGGSGLGWLLYLGEAEVLVDFLDGRLEEDRGALRFDEFGDFHRGFEADRGGGVFVAQDLSKSVDGEVGQVAEFVEHLVGALLSEGEEGAGEVRESAGPEVAWLEFEGGAVDTGFPGSSGRRGLRRGFVTPESESASGCRIVLIERWMAWGFPDSMLLLVVVIPGRRNCGSC